MKLNASCWCCRQKFDSFLADGCDTLTQSNAEELLVQSKVEGAKERLCNGEPLNFKCYVDAIHGSWNVAKVTPGDYTMLGLKPSQIGGAENRPLSLRQLKQLREFFKSQANEAGEMTWVDVAPPQYSKSSGQQLQLDSLNLYSTATWLIEPATREAKCSFSELMNTEAKKPKTFVSHWW